MNSQYQQLLQNLDYLKLKQMAIHLNETVEFGVNNQLSFVETLIKLTNYEIDVREQNMMNSMVKVGAFPHLKEITEFDLRVPAVHQQTSDHGFRDAPFS